MNHENQWISSSSQSNKYTYGAVKQSQCLKTADLCLSEWLWVHLCCWKWNRTCSEYVFSTSEMPFLRVTHLFTSPPCCNLTIHHQPVKPDRWVAYQAFYQIGCPIVLLKHPPAFCLLPPTPKPPEVGEYRPPPVCNSSAVHAACTFPQHSWSHIFAWSNLVLLIFPFGWDTFFQVTDGLRNVSHTMA